MLDIKGEKYYNKSMKKHTVFYLSIFIVVMLVPPKLISSERKITFSINGDIGKMFGSTKYHILANGYVPESDTDITIESELEFPVDVFITGINTRINTKLWQNASLSFNLNIHKSIGNPKNSTLDSDWFTFPSPGGNRVKFSYTESKSKLNVNIIDAEQRFEFCVSPKFRLAGILGYKYLGFSYEIFGVSGWFLDSTYHRIYYDEYEGVNVLNYNVSYYIPYSGFAAAIGISPDITLDGEYELSPYTLSKDFDNHILRNKTGEGNCSGNSFITNLNTVIKIPYPGSNLGWYAKINLNFMKVITAGYQTQKWYGDDPASTGDDTGNIITGINDQIIYNSQKVVFLIGCKF